MKEKETNLEEVKKSIESLEKTIKEATNMLLQEMREIERLQRIFH